VVVLPKTNRLIFRLSFILHICPNSCNFLRITFWSRFLFVCILFKVPRSLHVMQTPMLGTKTLKLALSLTYPLDHRFTSLRIIRQSLKPSQLLHCSRLYCTTVYFVVSGAGAGSLGRLYTYIACMWAVLIHRVVCVLNSERRRVWHATVDHRTQGQSGSSSSAGVSGRPRRHRVLDAIVSVSRCSMLHHGTGSITELTKTFLWSDWNGILSYLLIADTKTNLIDIQSLSPVGSFIAW